MVDSNRERESTLLSIQGWRREPTISIRGGDIMQGWRREPTISIRGGDIIQGWRREPTISIRGGDTTRGQAPSQLQVLEGPGFEFCLFRAFDHGSDNEFAVSIKKIHGIVESSMGSASSTFMFRQTSQTRVFLGSLHQTSPPCLDLARKSLLVCSVVSGDLFGGSCVQRSLFFLLYL